jgi:hypothetical protein
MNVFCGVKASTLVVVEHDGGVLKGSSISAIAAASALGEGSTVVEVATVTTSTLSGCKFWPDNQTPRKVSPRGGTQWADIVC